MIRPKFEDLSEDELQYIAGLVDSRGSLFCQKVMQPEGKNYNYIPMMTFHTKDSKRIYPLTRLYKAGPRNKFQMGKNRTIDMLKAVYPFLRYRKRMARKLLELEQIRATAKRGPNLVIESESLERIERLYQDFIRIKEFRDDGVDE